MRVAVTTDYGYWGDISPLDILEPGSTRMLGGGETAMIHLSTALAAAGHHVDLFYDTRRPGKFAGVNYLGKSLKIPLLCSTDYDLLISWEDYQSLEINHRARKAVLAVQCNTLQLGVRCLGIDMVQAVSNWHEQQLKSTEPARVLIDRIPFTVLPNGIDPARYASSRRPFREAHRVIHSSSPDRGLHHLLNIWPRVRRRVPDATLHIYYDMSKWFQIIDMQTASGFRGTTWERSEQIKAGLALGEGKGVVVHGGIGQWDLAVEQMKASLMVYPCDPIQPTEGFSISILESLWAGTPVITTEADALPELWGGVTTQLPLPLDEDLLYETVVESLKREGDELWLLRSEAGKQYAEGFTWEKIGQEYVRRIERLASGNGDTPPLTGRE